MATRKVMPVLALWAGIVSAQTAQISGLIRDPANLPVRGAQIAVRNEQTGGRRNVSSNERGNYSIPSLHPGVYRLTVHATGFETIVREDIRLEVDESARLDFKLLIGNSRTVITVNSDSPPVNGDNASVGTTVNRDIIDQLPLNGRGIQSLIELTPGVTVVPVADSSRGQFAVNGQRSDANSFTVDGVSANFATGDPLAVSSQARQFTVGQSGGGMIPANNFLGTFTNLVPPEALEEFRIQTSTFAPEYGRSPGAQVELVTRSGTNQYHGSLFEYLRNDKTDANDFFSNQQGFPKAPLRFNDFGASLGGPVRIPHLYNGRDRTFFFAVFENLIMLQPQPVVPVAVPSLAARQNAPPAIAPLLDAYPLPNLSSDLFGDPAVTGLSGYAGDWSLRQDQQSYGIRLDHAFTDNLTAFVRYNYAPSERHAPPAGIPLASNLETVRINTQSLTGGFTQTVSPTLVNEIRWNASLQTANAIDQLSTADGAVPPPASLLFAPPYGYSGGTVAFGLSTAPLLTAGRLSKESGRQLQAIDNLSWDVGVHRLKFGVDYRWFSPVEVGPQVVVEWLGNTPVFTSPGVYNTTVPVVISETQADPRVAYSVPEFSAYAQDSWRIRQGLTVTYGVRWEVDPSPRVIQGQAAVIEGLSSLVSMAGTSFVPSGKPFYPTTWRNFAPRAGLAWELHRGSRASTVLRAGAGLFYDTAQGDFEDMNYYSPSITGYENQPIGSPTGGTVVSLGLIPLIGFGSVQAAAPGYTLPRTWEGNVTLEQSLGQQSLSAGYVWARGRRLIGYANQLPNPQPYSDVTVQGNDGSSSYNALQMQFNRKLSERLLILVSYTWAHSIDNISNDAPYFGQVRTLTEYWDPNIDRGSSDFDVRHSLNGSLIAALPSPAGGIWRRLFQKWTFNSIFFARSALPTDLLSNPDDLSDRPNVVPRQPLYLYGGGYPGGKSFNAAAFQALPVLVEGDLGRNVLRGLGAWQIDLALHRTVRLWERSTAEFRMETFNFLNHPNFANPSNPGDPVRLTLAQSPGFGVATQSLANGLAEIGVPGGLSPLFQIGGPRSIQFALRVRF
jgi:hypothetical protein